MKMKKAPGRAKTLSAEAEEVMFPESSNVLGATYYRGHKVLRVRFKKDGKLTTTYDYTGVKPETFAALLAAPSKGEFVNRTLIPEFDVRQVA